MTKFFGIIHTCTEIPTFGKYRQLENLRYQQHVLQYFISWPSSIGNTCTHVSIINVSQWSLFLNFLFLPQDRLEIVIVIVMSSLT